VRTAGSWLAPDLALALAAVTLFYCLFFFQGYQKLFRDSDAGWHIRTGERILASHQLPHTDSYSFSRESQPWFAWEWLADVATGAMHRTAGLAGVALFYGSVIACGVWLWFRLHWAMGGNFFIACAMCPLALSTCNIHWLARPHVIGWLFLLIAVLWAEKPHASFGWLDALAIGGFSALWANTHASFFLAPMVFGVYVLRRSSWYVWAALVAAVGPLLNPYGWHLYQHVFRYLADSELLARISEFQTFDFHTAGSGQIIAALILGIAGGTLAFTQGRYERAALAVLFSVVGIRSARGLPLIALVLLPIANGAIAPLLPRGFSEYCKRLRAIDARLSGVVLAPILIALAFLVLQRLPVGFPPDQFPVAAYVHIPADARLFSSDKFGGYLIYRSNGERKVFFDGRSDFYGVDFLKQVTRVVQLRPGWQTIFDSYRFSHALLPQDYPLTQALEERGWQEVYRDKTAVLLARGRT